MTEQNNVTALKKLAAKMIGGATSAGDIPGNTIADVLEVITENYQGATPLILGELTVTSSAGTDAGSTKVTVSPELSTGNSYRYKTEPSGGTLPERNEDLSSWASWDGKSEIEAEDGHKLIVCEVDANNLAIKGGVATIATV